MTRLPKNAVIDLFSGAGGMAEGFEQAGFVTAVATDYDEMAAKTFQFNHPGTPFIVRGIQDISSEELLETANLHSGNVRVVCGGPPCQGFSLAGQRIADDPRNKLFKEFVRIVEGTSPEYLVFENVSGMVSMQGGAVVRAVIKEFERLGYNCTARVLNAADYGVPQARPRFIILGSRDHSTNLFPEPTHFPSTKTRDSQTSFLSTQRQLTVWDALSDLPIIHQGEGAEELPHTGKYTNEFQLERRGRRTPGLIYNHRATSHSQPIIDRYAAIPEGGDNSQVPEELRTKKTNVFKLHRGRPSRTVTCNHRTDLLHPLIPRGTTVREAARLQSFDDDYRFFGNLTRKAKWTTQDDQVGNAVPPLLARAIAERLKEVIDSNEKATREWQAAAKVMAT